MAFDLKDYAHVDHGYAATIHNAQGMTVDKVQVLATPGMDRHGAYVALSRHRSQVDLHYGKDDFADRRALTRTLSRERAKDMASDYTRQREKATELQQGRDVGQPGRDTPTRIRISRTGALADLLKGTEPAPQRQRQLNIRVAATLLEPAPERTSLEKAVQGFARSAQDIVRMRGQGLAPLGYHNAALTKAGRELNALSPGSGGDLGMALSKDHSLIGEAASGITGRAIEAMRNEQVMRIEAQDRADRFVHDWQTRSRQLQRLRKGQDYIRASTVTEQLGEMAQGLHRDPQLESLLRNRRKELGLPGMSTGSVPHELELSISRSRSRGLGL